MPAASEGSANTAECANLKRYANVPNVSAHILKTNRCFDACVCLGFFGQDDLCRRIVYICNCGCSMWEWFSSFCLHTIYRPIICVAVVAVDSSQTGRAGSTGDAPLRIITRILSLSTFNLDSQRLMRFPASPPPPLPKHTVTPAGYLQHAHLSLFRAYPAINNHIIFMTD